MHLQPALLSQAEAIRLFNSGEIEECLSGLQGSSEHWAAILGTRCFLRAGRIAEAQATIEAYWPVVRDVGTDRERGEAATIRGAIAGRSGNRILALSSFSDARGYLFSVEDADFALADLENYQAAFALNESDIATAVFCANVALGMGGDQQRVYSRELLSQVCAKNDDFNAQFEFIKQNLSDLLETNKSDYLLAATLRNLALLAQQQDRIDYYKLLAETSARLTFRGEARKFESDFYRELGLLAARFGDHLTAFRYLRRSGDAAPTVFHKLTALLDGAAVAREIGETVASADRISHAEDLAAAIDWKSASLHDRLTLFVLAEEQARIDVRSARETYGRVMKLTRGHLGNAGPSVLTRFQALSTRANGIITAAEGNEAKAQTYLEQAFRYWRSIEFNWEAATTAIELVEATLEDRYAEYILSYLQVVPSAYLRRRLDAATSKRAQA